MTRPRVELTSGELARLIHETERPGPNGEQLVVPAAFGPGHVTLHGTADDNWAIAKVLEWRAAAADDVQGVPV